MEIRAYNEEYMPLARKVLGDAVDFAVVTLGIDPDKFMEMFWFSGRSFRRITKAVPLSGIISMYSVYHEMDPMKFRDEMDQRLRMYYQAPVLKEKRCQAGLSQSALARLSGVPLRQIQLFEQGHRDIRKTQAQTLLRLCKTLHCDMEALME